MNLCSTSNRRGSVDVASCGAWETAAALEAILPELIICTEGHINAKSVGRNQTQPSHEGMCGGRLATCFALLLVAEAFVGLRDLPPARGREGHAANGVHPEAGREQTFLNFSSACSLLSCRWPSPLSARLFGQRKTPGLGRFGRFLVAIGVPFHSESFIRLCRAPNFISNERTMARSGGHDGWPWKFPQGTPNAQRPALHSSRKS